MYHIFRRMGQSIRWRLGHPVAAPQLEEGTDSSVTDFYNSRVTKCEFLDDPTHYEYPRAAWILENANGGDLLEIGCGNGGMTKLLSTRVSQITALDVSEPSLKQLEGLALPNVTTVQALIENFEPQRSFDLIVMSEVIEHLREPFGAIDRAFDWLSPGGKLLITTPNGHWETDEHLHVFSLASFCEMLGRINCEQLTAGYRRDADGRRRWLTAILTHAESPPTPDDFFNPRATARKRSELRRSGTS